MGVHYSFDDLWGLGEDVVRAAKAAADRFWSSSFSLGLPADPNPPSIYRQRTPRTGRPDPNYLDAILSDIPGQFAAYAGPDPGGCVGVISNDTAITQALVGSIDGRYITDKNAFPPLGAFRPEPAIVDNIADIDSSMIGWAGRGASAFDDYLSRLGNTVKRQNDVTDVLALGMRAHHDILTGAYTDIWSLGQEAIKIMDNGGQSSCSGRGAQITLYVVSGLAWIAAVPTAGTDVLLASAITAFAAASGTAPSFIPASEAHTSIEGNTLLDVLNNLRTNISDLTKKTTRQQQALAGKLAAAANVISGEYSRGELSPPKPADTLNLHGKKLSQIKDDFYPNDR